METVESQAELFQKESIQFDSDLDELKIIVRDEETKLNELEERRLSLKDEIDNLEKDILNEKLKNREVIIGIIKQHDTFDDDDPIESDFKIALENFKKAESIDALIESTKKAAEDIISEKFELELDIDKFRDEFIEENLMSSKDDYMNSINTFILAAKQKDISNSN